jgi:purine-nucleoside phosphorylase
MAITIESIQEAADGLKAILPEDFRPEIGIIGGSGLSALEHAVDEPKWEVPYGKIKGFPVSTGKFYLITKTMNLVQRNLSLISDWYF